MFFSSSMPKNFTFLRDFNLKYKSLKSLGKFFISFSFVPEIKKINIWHFSIIESKSSTPLSYEKR